MTLNPNLTTFVYLCRKSWTVAGIFVTSNHEHFYSALSIDGKEKNKPSVIRIALNARHFGFTPFSWLPKTNRSNPFVATKGVPYFIKVIHIVNNLLNFFSEKIQVFPKYLSNSNYRMTQKNYKNLVLRSGKDWFVYSINSSLFFLLKL